ncbi:D-amino-acid transaminase [Oceanibacterium hippocampi]|uniref:Probable branched-chain-amino-acid aminotransferase n=1 Tax=Oceanibacterium hippocampi TaxID=745714 RepID=A0A1Y5T2X4_9PROT|nr:D-amino-acid transaminase [Oceanibacterium hippocampi]SLN54704.1 D-alanine aminotransferase [Oceanibacterium hippocampi]
MSRIAYVNGRYVPHAEAVVHIEDRGYQFADGVYEVIAVAGGRLIDEIGHLERLDRSLRELRISPPMAYRSLALVIRETLRRNRVRDGIVYLQITRGVSRRDHPFPDGVRPALVLTAKSVNFAAVAARAEKGVRVITVEDIRWARRDIKSISLLPNVLAKQDAREAGAYEAFQVDGEGLVTEGSSTNAWIIDTDGRLVTRDLGTAILPGITRQSVIDIARQNGYTIVERAFTVEELKSAREVFLTSTTSFVMPVVQVDDKVIGNGQPGSLSTALLAAYRDYMDEVGHAA